MGGQVSAVLHFGPWTATPSLLSLKWNRPDALLSESAFTTGATTTGFLPAGAASYDEAAKLAQETAFDCITLDLSLGNHAGTEMLHHLSMLGSTAPIIVVSGADYATCKETVKVAERLNLDIWECIPKPVDLVMLRHFLERLKASWNTVAVAA